MASFTPLESTEDINASTLRRQRHAGGGGGNVPVGIVIDKSCRVYITNIPVERIERDGAGAMRAELEMYGPVESYRMFTEKSGRFIGSALCTFRNAADATSAIAGLNGQVVEGATLRVETARDHGVLLLNSDRRAGFLPRRLAATGHDGGITSGADSGRWRHDRYELLAEGKDMDEVLGIRPRHGGRGGRGGRGGGLRTRGERIDAAFDRYIQERDALLEKGAAAEGEATAAPAQPVATDGAVADSNSAAVGSAPAVTQESPAEGEATTTTNNNDSTGGGDDEEGGVAAEAPAAPSPIQAPTPL